MKSEKNITKRALLLGGALILFALAQLAAAQTPSPAPPPMDGPDTSGADQGEVQGGYLMHQSIEFGGQAAEFSGNGAMWNTFVNQGSGPRLLGQSLDMHSVDHKNLWFDELHESAYGLGGEPNQWLRVRVSKSRLYDFSLLYRHDRNYFDYDLMANPLNPATSVPNIPVLNSPHTFETVRRTTDTNLTILPQSAVRFRLGWSRSSSEGPSFSTVHEGTEGLTFQNWRNGVDTYQAGVDFRVLPRTTFSYDQFISVYKGDTSQTLNSLPFLLNPTTPVDLGLPFNTLANQPCATPILGTGFANPACNGYFAYNRLYPIRNLYPTEQFSFQSNYWKRVDLTGRVTYTGADSDMGTSSEFFNGLTTRTRARNQLTVGPASARRINGSADFGATWHITDKLAFVDDFRWTVFRSPGQWLEGQSTLFGATLLSNPNTFTPATCPPPFTAATCPQHINASGPDVILGNWNRYLAQEVWFNTAELEYQFNRRYRISAGYRYRHRDIDTKEFDLFQLTYFPGPSAALANRGACVGQPLNPDGTCTVLTFNGQTAAEVVPTFDGLTPDTDHIPINEHSLLFGFYAHPWEPFTITYDMELMYADNTYVRIDPRQMQLYRLRMSYKPVEWASLSAAINIRENRNNVETVDNLQHNRSYSVSAVLSPRSNLGFDFAYNYNDVFSQTNICFVSSAPPPGTIGCGTPFLQDISVYDQTVHYVSANVLWQPWRRLTTTLGYTGSFANGDTLILNPFAPLGPLNYDYHLPVAGVRFELAPRWTLSGGWNFYDYAESGDPGPTLPRNFRGNVVSTGIRYAF
jgi:hypothetical protein